MEWVIAVTCYIALVKIKTAELMMIGASLWAKDSIFMGYGKLKAWLLGNGSGAVL